MQIYSINSRYVRVGNIFVLNNLKYNLKQMFQMVTEFTEEKIKFRYVYLYQELSDFLTIYSLGEKYRIDQIALTNAILDYFTDISGLKKMHNIKNVNEIKVCAHRCYWFLRKIIFY